MTKEISQRLAEIQAALALRKVIETRIAELIPAEREAEMNLFGIRVALTEARQALAKAEAPRTEGETPHIVTTNGHLQEELV